MSEQVWLDRHHEGCRTVRSCARQLDSMAGSLARIGMRELAEEIGDVAVALVEAEQAITRANGEHIHEQFEHSRHMADALLEVAIKRIAPKAQ